MTVSNGAVVVGLTVGLAGLGWIWGKYGNFFSRLAFVDEAEVFFFFLTLMTVVGGWLARAFPRFYWLGIPAMAYALAYLINALALQEAGQFWFYRAEPFAKIWHKKYLNMDAFVQGRWLPWSPKVTRVLDWLTWANTELVDQIKMVDSGWDEGKPQSMMVSALLMKAQVYLANHQSEAARKIVLSDLPSLVAWLPNGDREYAQAQADSLLAFSYTLDGEKEKAEEYLRKSKAVVRALKYEKGIVVGD